MSIATAEQPPQRVGLEEGAIAQLRLHVRVAVAQVHQRQWPEDHERGGAGDGGGDEQQGEEHDHGSRDWGFGIGDSLRSEEQTSELQSLMRNSYAVFCLKKKKKN